MMQMWHGALYVAGCPGHAPFRAEDYECFREWYGSHDGARVPVTLVRKRGVKRNGR